MCIRVVPFAILIPLMASIYFWPLGFCIIPTYSTGIAIGGCALKTSVDRILTTHVGSIPRPESIKELLRARLEGEQVDESQLAERVQEERPETRVLYMSGYPDVPRDRKVARTPITPLLTKPLHATALLKAVRGVPSNGA